MRYFVVGLVLASQIASADPEEYRKPWERAGDVGVSLEIAGGWQRIHTNGITYRAEYLRFAPQIALGRWLYIGAAIQIGHIYGSSGMLDGQVYQPPGSSGFVDESTGTIAAPQALVGARDLIGIVSGAVEIAPTVRWTSASTNSQGLTFTTSVATIELHARADVWATPHLSAGLMVGMDLASVRDFEAGLQLAFHFEPYDTMKPRVP
ncbi:MAG TPA: hypothetical protein VFQ65_17575 [Kofleriaceae bacterium]|nr:hypothetical protein [Kofleriaceae bacterium]